ncbi:hypothetical protein [Duganella phyllosphaerae]|uniref:Uncharacterized protein n=1 Tax=Duganella phyllosphaerae TaxID=762836 RepID=A0A1E7X7P4_9BURK|nr:hypothetical protein [Duganella phyllosphaerae]OFA09135.1 hypothetical protein DUPY_01810 [Duganella phyllosphaerae]
MQTSSLSVLLATLSLAGTVHAVANAPAASAPDLDLAITYYSKTLTPDGVTRESRYQETMLRRPGHVWSARVLPANAPQHQHQHQNEEGGHRHGLNHIAMPRHVIAAGKTPRLEFVDAREKAVITIPATEFDNVNFDGSWDRAFYLLDPRLLKTMTVTTRASTTPGARWREREDNGVYQRVLWDEQRQIPLMIESGDKAGTFYRRVDVVARAGATPAPWKNLHGYAQREFADFLD